MTGCVQSNPLSFLQNIHNLLSQSHIINHYTTITVSIIVQRDATSQPMKTTPCIEGLFSTQTPRECLMPSKKSSYVAKKGKHHVPVHTSSRATQKSINLHPKIPPTHTPFWDWWGISCITNTAKICPSISKRKKFPAMIPIRINTIGGLFFALN